MYESFFGLKENPFNLTPDPRFFYLSESHREALAALVYGVRERAGLMTLTGPVGVGKTMILASFLDQIKAHAESASFSGSISGDRTEFLKELCRVLGISLEQYTLFGLSQAIRDFALKKTGEGRSVVVLVDEAQDLSLEELDHFHHLSNLETPEAKLLQIVLAGTEELDEKLKAKSLEALSQRVAIRSVIEPLETVERIEYISHRLRVAGGSSSQLLTEGALWRIANYARGLPRLVNLVCNHAMITAFSSGRLPVDEDAVCEAVKDLGGSEDGIEAEEIAPREQGRETRRTVDLSWFRQGRRSLATSVVFLLLLSSVGVLVTTGLLKRSEGEVEPVVVPSTEEPALSKGDDSLEMMALWDYTRDGGPERTVMEEVGKEGEVTEKEEVTEEEATEEEGVPDGREKVTVRGRDLAGIALEQYGRLDVEMLKLLRDENPQIKDWNSLDQEAQLVLPDMPEGTGEGADFYTVQVGAFKAQEGAFQTASDLEKKAAQNLFLVRADRSRLTFVCVGVYESVRQSLASIRQMKDWGYDDAFPTRIQVKRLEDILQPGAASIVDKPGEDTPLKIGSTGGEKGS